MRKQSAPFLGFILSAAFLSPAGALAQVKGATIECEVAKPAVIAAEVVTPADECITIDNPIYFTGDVSAKSDPKLYQPKGASYYAFGKFPNAIPEVSLRVIGCSGVENCSDNLAVSVLKSIYVKADEISARGVSEGMNALFNIGRDSSSGKETITGQLTIDGVAREKLKEYIKKGPLGGSAKGCITSVSGAISVVGVRAPSEEESEFDTKLQEIAANPKASEEERSAALDALEASKLERERARSVTPRKRVSKGLVALEFDNSGHVFHVMF